ncbi:YhcH/YjgK/YiaL family protein [Sediminispirochaeta bajacaliforniensis]|uniref:YhcH/YjgK/YiaL family protein n=1 Tax=Sediminispirochaeta bajacaliforniensis TaxID=148 RepID=UPI00037ECB92|nr:YhcH/YjgK/YiaL family protein [Sediminispirochaeta bajacaliforniensis]
MIIDTLHNAHVYYGCHKRFEEAFSFLSKVSSFDELPSGRIDIDGDRLYAFTLDGEGKGCDAAVLETHRRYIDIQYTVYGEDLMGWNPLSPGTIGDGYDPDKDIEFYSKLPVRHWFPAPAGAFFLFFPSDMHAPLGATGHMRKIIVKVATSD